MKKNTVLRYLLVGAVAFILGVAISHNVRAEFFNGGDLLKALRSAPASQARMVGIGYVMGASDMGMWNVHCIPDGVKATQIADVISTFIESRPDLQNQPADAFVANLLNRAYPCLPNEKEMVQK